MEDGQERKTKHLLEASGLLPQLNLDGLQTASEEGREKRIHWPGAFTRDWC